MSKARLIGFGLIAIATGLQAQEVDFCDYPTAGNVELFDLVPVAYDLSSGWWNVDDEEFQRRVTDMVEIADRFYALRLDRSGMISEPVLDWMIEVEAGIRLKALGMIVLKSAKLMSSSYEDVVRMTDKFGATRAEGLGLELVLYGPERGAVAFREWANQSSEAGC